MADKFRQTFPIAVTFSEGELPTASKMTGFASQARSGQGIMQYALGDLWNQGGDPLLGNATDMADNALMIPNLARYLGAAKHANPSVPALSAIEEYTFNFTAHGGLYEARLTFPLATGAATPTWDGTSPPSTKKSSRGAVAVAGDYYIDDVGNFYSYSPIHATWEITYEPEVVGNVGSSFTWNLIPEVYVDGTPGFQGLKIQYKNATGATGDNSAGYYIYLPPRMPKYNIGSSARPDWYPDAKNNQSSSPTTEKLFWQSTSQPVPTGANAAHYRYTLPISITGSSAWAAGAILPAGMVYLWDEYITGTIVEGAVFKALPSSPTTWGLFVPNGTPLDDWLNSPDGQLIYPVTTLRSLSHEQSYYPNTGLKLITVGSSVSQMIESLMSQLLSHDHSVAHSMTARPIEHSKLAGNVRLGGTPLLHVSGYSDEGDTHPQYLERHGYDTGRDKYGNSMLGDLLLASSSPTDNYHNTNANSRRLYFNNYSLTDGAAIWQQTGSYPGLTLVSRIANGGNAVYVGDPSAINSYIKLNANSAGTVATINNSVNGTELRLRSDGGGASPLSLYAGGTMSQYSGAWWRVRAGSGAPNPSMDTKDIGLFTATDLRMHADGNVDLVSGYDNAPHGWPGYTNDMALRSGSDIFLRAKGVVDIHSSGETRLDGAGNLDLIPGGTMYLYPGGNLYMNKNPLRSSWRTTYIAVPVLNWIQDVDLNERFRVYQNDRFWISKNGLTVLTAWFPFREFPIGGKVNGVRVHFNCDYRDNCRMYVKYGNYWNSMSGSIGSRGCYQNGGWKQWKITCNGHTMSDNQTLWLQIIHEDKNGNGSDGWLWFYSVIELELSIRQIAAY